MNEKFETKTLIRNRAAFHEYSILDKMEAGIALSGTEVKSLRSGKVTIKDAWVNIDSSLEAYLMQLQISAYDHGNIYNHASDRPRKLLLHKRQLKAWYEQLKQKSITAVPLSIYLKGRRIKVQIALAKGKKLYDKRETEKKRDAEREISRAMRGEK